MKCTTRSNAINRQLESLQSMVETVKQDKEVQKAAMHFQEYIDAERRNAREEERKNTLLEKKRADEAEKRVAELEKQLASLQKEREEAITPR